LLFLGAVLSTYPNDANIVIAVHGDQETPVDIIWHKDRIKSSAFFSDIALSYKYVAIVFDGIQVMVKVTCQRKWI
jgi:hypothetical protein